MQTGKIICDVDLYGIRVFSTQEFLTINANMM